MDTASPPRAPLATLLPSIFAGRARPALEALVAIERELRLATRPGIEHSVAHAKLGWWRAEVERLCARVPQHPLTRTLHGYAGGAPDWALLHERLAAADLALGGALPANDTALEAYLYRSHGALCQLGAQLLAGGRSDSLSRFGALLGRGLGLAELRAGGLAAADTKERALERLAMAEAVLLPSDRARQAPALVAAALARATLARPAQAPAPAAIVQLWIAWRAARRATRDARRAEQE